MGRPKTPLIDRDEAIAKALNIIDLEGLDAFSIRRLGKELGVNGASLYHHFRDKDDILHGVRRLILLETGVYLGTSKSAPWQKHVTKSVASYRTALLRHPNAAPLMTRAQISASAHAAREYMLAKMLDDGVPLNLTYPIIDSVETFAFGSALVNPQQAHPNERLALPPGLEVPLLRASIRSGYRGPDKLFRPQLQALLAGWTVLIEQAKTSS